MTGCNPQSNPTSQDSTPKVVKIWLVGPLSGPAANYGTDMVNIHTYLAEKFNQEHSNVQVELHIEDGKCEGKDATSAAQKLINVDQVDFFNGAACSSEAIPLGQLAQEKSKLFVNGVSSSPEMGKIGNGVFNYVNDAHAAKALAEFVPSKAKSIILVYDNNDFAKGIAEEFKAAYTGNLLKEIALSLDEQDYTLVIKQIQKIAPEGIVFVNGNDTTLVNELKSLEREGFLEQYKEKLFTAYVLDSSVGRSEAGTLLDGIYQVNIGAIDDFGAKALAFMKEYKSQHTITANESFSLTWAEAFSLTLDAIAAGNYDSASIKAYLDAITEKNPRAGLLGTYYFENNQVIGLPYIIQQMSGGSLVRVQ